MYDQQHKKQNHTNLAQNVCSLPALAYERGNILLKPIKLIYSVYLHIRKIKMKI